MVDAPPPLPAELDAARRLGQNTAGPMLASFAHWAAGRALGGRLFACLRDGGFLGRLVEAAAPRIAVTPVWLSRKLCLTAAIDGAGDADGLANLLVRARGVPATMAQALAELGLDDLAPPLPPTTPVDAGTLPALVAWLARDATAANRLHDHCQRTRAGILAHLRQVQALDSRGLALLDVGYAGNVARALALLFRRLNLDCPVRAVLLAATPGCRWTRAAGAEVEGHLLEDGRPDWLAAPLIRHREVLESLCVSPFGPLLDHASDGSPRSAPPLLPPGQLAQVAALQQAAAAFCADQPPPSSDQARRMVRALLLTPTAEQAAVLGGWQYQDDMAVGGCRRLDQFSGGGEVLDATRAQCLWPAAAALAAGMDEEELRQAQAARHPAITA